VNVIEIPASLDSRTVDELLDTVAAAPVGKVLLDAKHVRWVAPTGMVALLACASVAKQRGSTVILRMPEQPEVTGYLARMGFFAEAERLMELDQRPPHRDGGDSDVLLEITPVSTHSDVHQVVDRVQTRAGAILSRTLGYPLSAVVQFSVLLSEVCQNIIEHANAPGWVAAQAYNWQKRLGRHVLVIAVSDLGRGFKGSLAEEHSVRYGDRWSDATALEAAFLHGMTRFPDSGRGQGLQQIRKQVRRWDGILSIRSGTARIADVPPWDDTQPLVQGLAPFPGAHIAVVLPAALSAAPVAPGRGAEAQAR
jgi:anti-sigma regulatory factor (Ser/Thr protein kinase)